MRTLGVDGIQVKIANLFTKGDNLSLSMDEIRAATGGSKTSISTAICNLRSSKYCGKSGVVSLMRFNGKYCLEDKSVNTGLTWPGPKPKHINSTGDPENRLSAMIHRVRMNARKYNRECTITEEDITVPTHCPILGIELTNVRGGKEKSHISFDRKDSTKGYTPENTWIISLLANTMKNNATPEELVAFANGILKNYT